MNLEELKQKAEAATPGVWIAAWPYVVIRDPADPDKPIPIIGKEWPTWEDCNFIAAANPETVLALVKVAEAVRELAYTIADDTVAIRDAERKMFDALDELEAME